MDALLFRQAVKALKVDVPVLDWSVKDGVVTLKLLGGDIKTWKVPEEAPEYGRVPKVEPEVVEAEQKLGVNEQTPGVSEQTPKTRRKSKADQEVK